MEMHMKPLNEMTRRELLAWADANNFALSSATRLKRSDLERALRILMQQRNRDQQRQR
jgi:hypothetical protein